MRGEMVAIAIAGVLIVFLAVGSLAFTLNKCGAKGLLFGKSGVWVAASGVCDK